MEHSESGTVSVNRAEKKPLFTETITDTLKSFYFVASVNRRLTSSQFIVFHQAVM